MMRVLVVCRQGIGSRPYITEQVVSLENKGIICQYFFIRGSRIRAYLSSLKQLKRQIRIFNPDIIHAHYGLSGLFANFQRSVPVVTTFHGSDINFWKIRPFSLLASKLSNYSIFVSEKLAHKARPKKKYIIQPCGLDFDTFYPVEKEMAREKMKLDLNGKYILFSGSFNNRIKNATLANTALESFEEKVVLIELSGYTRTEVNLLFNACDLSLMTSLMEGSPQFIKEAMACNCPIVSTDVGSVREIFDGTDGCFLTSFDAADVAEKIQLAIVFGKRTNGRKKISHLDNQIIANNIITVYNLVVKK